jgi:hypothetical protein
MIEWRTSRIVIAAVIAASLSGAWASSVRSLDLDELTRRAAVIVSGRCQSVEVVFDPALGRKATVVTLAVDRSVKGPGGPTHAFRLPVTSGVDGWEIAGLPRFAPGEELVLFLYGPSVLGLSSPVGFGQGVFRVGADKHGRRVALNDHGNARLLRGLPERAAARVREAAPAWKDGAPIDPALLLDVATALGAAP